MNILALDTSSKAASCALWQNGVLKGEAFINAGLTHSQTILPMVESLLRDTATSLDRIDRFGVSAGPGSFTGLRIGLSAVKGMAMARNTPCVGVSTLEALAWNLIATDTIVAPVMDARCMQVYTALFRIEDGAVIRLADDDAIPIDELRQRLSAYSHQRVLLVGDGAELCYNHLSGQLPNLRLCPESIRHQRASSVAQLTALADTTVTPEALEPVYLRLPQAQRELMKKKEEEQRK